MILFAISFIAGVLTVLAPCVLPLLPVIVGGSLAAGERHRAYVIALSLGVSVILFTLLLKASAILIAVPQSFWNVFSGGILVLFGIVMLFPSLWDNRGFVNVLNRASNRALAAGYRRHSFLGDILMGAALGPVFSSCSPTYFIILATVLPASFAVGIADLLAYALGLSGFLLVITLLGQRLVDRLGVTIEPTGWFRRAIGALFILVGLGVLTGAEAQLEAYLLDRGFDVTTVEQQLLKARDQAADQSAGMCTSTECVSARAASSTALKAEEYPKAPELAAPDGYINTPRLSSGQAGPISIGQFKGKDVVLIDFWTYSCINCIRTIPYVESWYAKYKDQGLVVIGVHTPEFAFEHVYQNVQMATRQLGITYPVVLDNEYATWNAFGNQYWPREYLIDIDGYIVHDHSGEGDYDGTEAAIQQALRERARRLGLAAASTTQGGTPTGAIAIDFSGVQSPETYFGAARNEYLGDGVRGRAGKQSLTLPSGLHPNALYLGGAWNFVDQYASNVAAGATIQHVYSAKNVYLVAASPDGPVKLKVLRDGKPLPAAERGADVDGSGEVTVQEDRLYQLVAGSAYGEHTIELIIETPGLQAYTFTFG
jgi:cytochrome c biogenesis protein CcdA/thiol-disulfide isomerase/thioredoxin